MRTADANERKVLGEPHRPVGGGVPRVHVGALLHIGAGRFRIPEITADRAQRTGASGEAHRAHERRERDDGEHRRGLGLPVLREACDALLEAPFAAGHGRRAEQWVLRLIAHGHEREQSFSVGGALVRAERAERSLVTGQLAVLAREHRREPHERVEPVDGQAHAAQQRPQRV